MKEDPREEAVGIVEVRILVIDVRLRLIEFRFEAQLALGRDVYAAAASACLLFIILEYCLTFISLINVAV